MKRLQESKSAWRKWASSIAYAYGVVTFAWPVKAFAAVAAGGASAVGRAAHDSAERPSGSGRSRDHHRSDHRHRDHVVGERTRNRRAENVVARVRRLLRSGRNTADDDLIPTRWSALLGRIG